MGDTGGTPGVEGGEAAGVGELAVRREVPECVEPETRRTLGTLVEDGEVKRLSVSSVSRYDTSQPGGCPRRWWYRHVAGRPEPQGPAAKRGEGTHACVERHLIYKSPLVGIARAAAPLCAELAKERIAIEQPLGGALKADGVPFEGRIDIVRWEHHEVLDWKTTSKPRSELPLGQALLRTVQMPGYGKWLADAVQGARYVRLTHAYLAPGWAEPEIRSVKVPWAQLEERWREVEEVVRALRRDARAEKAEDVPANDRACDAHGGCPHREVCSVGKGVTRMGLMEDLKRGKRPGPTTAAQRIMSAAMQQEDAKQHAPPSILPPDAPKSGELAPKAAPVPAEKLAELPPVVREAVEAQGAVQQAEPAPAKSKARRKSPAQVTQEIVDAQADANTATEVAYEGAYTRCRVERVVNLGNYESARFELEMQITRATDPKAPLRALTRELDELAAEYVKSRAAAR